MSDHLEQIQDVVAGIERRRPLGVADEDLKLLAGGVAQRACDLLGEEAAQRGAVILVVRPQVACEPIKAASSECGGTGPEVNGKIMIDGAREEPPEGDGHSPATQRPC